MARPVKKALKKPRKKLRKASTGKKRLLAQKPFLIEIAPQEKTGQPSFTQNQSLNLPIHYGDNKIVLLVRDPWWLYAYWEVTPKHVENVLLEIQKRALQFEKTVVRVYDVKSGSFFDIELTGMANNWMIDVGMPDREWMVELGLRTSDGQFFVLVRSNSVRTPRFGVSDILDEEWMVPDELFWRLFGLSGGLENGKRLSSYYFARASSLCPSPRA